jgi:hypothetical protein
MPYAGPTRRGETGTTPNQAAGPTINSSCQTQTCHVAECRIDAALRCHCVAARGEQLGNAPAGQRSTPTGKAWLSKRSSIGCQPIHGSQRSHAPPMHVGGPPASLTLCSSRPQTGPQPHASQLLLQAVVCKVSQLHGLDDRLTLARQNWLGGHCVELAANQACRTVGTASPSLPKSASLHSTRGPATPGLDFEDERSCLPAPTTMASKVWSTTGYEPVENNLLLLASCRAPRRARALRVALAVCRSILQAA